MRDQAFRRHHRARMEDRAREVVTHSWGIDDPEDIESFVNQSADNLQVCSCADCGSPRRNKWAPKEERLTMPERKMLESFKDQMEAINDDQL